ncbi:MAG: hypothetical protein ACI9QL_005342, partial [Candidatus Omnitrophota bacterium]
AKKADAEDAKALQSEVLAQGAGAEVRPSLD